jgi:hypothetical protein
MKAIDLQGLHQVAKNLATICKGNNIQKSSTSISCKLTQFGYGLNQGVKGIFWLIMNLVVGVFGVC